MHFSVSYCMTSLMCILAMQNVFFSNLILDPICKKCKSNLFDKNKSCFKLTELKAQVGFSEDNLSGVCRRRFCRCRRKFLLFYSYSPVLLGKFQPNLAQIILGLREFKYVQMKFFSKERQLRHCENAMKHFKNHLLQNHCASFSQTCHKSSLSKG